MFTSFFVVSSTDPVQLLHHSRMSAQWTPKPIVGTVVRRPSEEVVSEMARIAVNDRARMSAQAEEAAEFAKRERARMSAQAPETPLYPGRFREERRHRQPLNPLPPRTPEEARVAAIRRREVEEEEANLLERIGRWANRPRAPTPPRRDDDHYDLARWAVRRGL